MPTLVRWYIRTALLSLLTACLAGGLVLAGKPLGVPWLAAWFQPVFYHLLMVGWATQLIAGVAIWMFPPLSKAQPRGNEGLGWAAYGALNGGLLLRVAAEPAQAAGGQPWAGPALIASAVLQTVAVYILILLLWPRVKGRARQTSR